MNWFKPNSKMGRGKGRYLVGSWNLVVVDAWPSLIFFPGRDESVGYVGTGRLRTAPNLTK